MEKLPETFKQNMRALLGEEDYQDYLLSFTKPRVYGLRVNELKLSPEEFQKLSDFELVPIPWTKNGFYYHGESERAAKHPYYFAGLYYLQEPSAMTPASLLPIEPGDRVLDTCAAPGGKSTELLAKLGGTGVLYSNDISNSRAQALLKNLELFGAENAVILSEDLRKMEKRFAGYFDKILVDAPCSGEGMFRKEPAVIKSWEEHGNAFYVSLQRSIVESALKMLRPGGKMVYSTCTFSPLEDEDMLLYMKSLCPGLKVLPIEGAYSGFSCGMPEKAAKQDPELQNAIRIFPHKVEGEGHFVALLEKPADGSPRPLVPRSLDKNSIKKLPPEAETFLKQIHKDFSRGSFSLRNEKLYYLMEDAMDLSGLRVLREGLLLGEVKKNRFEPSQALAMALKKGEFSTEVDLSLQDPRVLKYLKGETLDISDLCPQAEGYALVEVDGFPLGFGKARNGVLKNHYLPGWRYQ